MELIKSLWKSFYIGLIALAIIALLCIIVGIIVMIIGALVGLIWALSKAFFITALIIGSIILLGALVRNDLGG